MKIKHLFGWLVVFACVLVSFASCNHSTEANNSRSVSENVSPLPSPTVDAKKAREEIAKGGRALWTYKINSDVSFDIASKCEMLVFVEVFNQYDNLTEIELSKRLGVRAINSASISRWKEETKNRIIDNFRSLSEGSLGEIISIDKNSSWETISKIPLQERIPGNLRQWYEFSKRFYDRYLNEQLRLAALFPRTTSEIIGLSENEISGHEFAQKHFLLTFDDGPSGENGNTDKLIKVLNNLQLKSAFFVLGRNLQNRLNASSEKSLRELYGQNLVFSHGKVHLSHQKYSQAQVKDSIDFTSQLIEKIFSGQNKTVYFRPPYGQRNQFLSDYLASQNSKVILWNIDSHDWMTDMDAEQAADREITLMLLWRKGILLFHDIHPKAQRAVPIIYNYFKDANIKWMNPKDL
jgi:peptidoglycan-N-acetylglucosamine deacetylase